MGIGRLQEMVKQGPKKQSDRFEAGIKSYLGNPREELS